MCIPNIQIQEILEAYIECRKKKTNTIAAIDFHANLEKNIYDLYIELKTGTYKISRGIRFVVTRPKPREIWAANFRDRVVQHYLYSKISSRFLNSFCVDSCACIQGRGTLYGVRRLENKIRSASNNYNKEQFYLKCDLANFFGSIDKEVLFSLLKRKIHEPELLELTRLILFHDPRIDYIDQSTILKDKGFPFHKSLFSTKKDIGLPVGNLSSQFFANVLLDSLDQYCKRVLKIKHYIRYVDDIVILGDNPKILLEQFELMKEFVKTIKLEFNDKKTIVQRVSRGVDFVGYVIYEYKTLIRKKTVKNSIFYSTFYDSKTINRINSYIGLFKVGSNFSRVKELKLAFYENF
ncbi:MAG: RNA-directed DNA polymerase [Sulfuricurvum sp.]